MIWVVAVLFILGAVMFAPRLVGGALGLASAIVFYGVMLCVVLAVVGLAAWNF
jgi:hypothetical protein